MSGAGQFVKLGPLLTTVTVCVQVLMLEQQSIACQTRVNCCEHGPLLVMVLRTVSVIFVQQLSVTAGSSNDHAEPHGTVLLFAQLRTGGVVPTTVTVWVQVEILLQQSMACQVPCHTVWQLVWETRFEAISETVTLVQHAS
jgi:hypothetical protein